MIHLPLGVPRPRGIDPRHCPNSSGEEIVVARLDFAHGGGPWTLKAFRREKGAAGGDLRRAVRSAQAANRGGVS